MQDRWSYIINLLMLVPVMAAMLFTADGGLRSVFKGKLADQPGFRLMILGFWLAVLVGSLLGLAQPRTWAPLLVVQVIYKSVWLLAFALPARRARRIRGDSNGHHRQLPLHRRNLLLRDPEPVPGLISRTG